jgi:cyclohexanecarboxylate-CoA ligase
MSEPIYDAVTLWDLVEQRAAASPDRALLLDPSGRGLTFGECKAWAERVAAGLLALGIGEGTPVSWQLPTRMETVVVSLALSRLGAVQNPILHLYREREVGFILRQMQPAFCLTQGTWRGVDYDAMVRTLAKDHERPSAVLVTYDELPEGDPATLPPAPLPSTRDDVRWLYYTSGTTSDPKGVRHSDATLLAGGAGLAQAIALSPEDIWAIAFPFAHIGGPDSLINMLMQGVPMVLFEEFIPADVIDVCRRLGVTVFGGSTAFYQALLAEQRKRPGEQMIPSLRMLTGGGAVKPPAVYFDVQREMGLKVVHGYALTEVPMMFMGRPDDTDEQLAYTEGRPVVALEPRIVAPDGQVAPTGVDGEVRVRGPMVCKGYTDAALTRDAFDNDGFYRTGDIGHLRDDGHVVVTGRLKDVIIRKGENISAREIEDLLYRHPKVTDVAVIGLPDPSRGERVCAVVERAPDQAPLTFEEMTTCLRDAGLMVQKIPEQLEVVDELPRNDTLRKVLKFKLRDKYADKPWPGGG